ncbi:MAG: thrombospondin type 3 repeat-containing protein [Rhodoferax sp.]|nr:thrombospondin type 3 repeat-containing protein [Rhodoferax sp.]
MKHLISTRALAAVAVALGAFAAASAAHARSDVYFSIGVQVPGIYVQPSPMHLQPRLVFMPAPGHFGRYERYGNDRRNHGQHWQSRGPYGLQGRDGSANVYGSGNPRNQWRQSRLVGPYGDLDRDGVRNQWDRDLDGDGVRNRYDHMPANPNRR